MNENPNPIDDILAFQLSVAWAGEGLSQPRRLGWWQTDLIDEAGGGDLLARLLPRTHAWAKLEAVREAAKRVDERARRRSATPDKLVTLFQLGFDLDEQLSERLRHHQRHQATPSEVLGARFVVAPTFDPAAFERFVRQSAPTPRVEMAPEGRLLPGGPPVDPLEQVSRLVAALAPFTPDYPMPHYRVADRPSR
jgi:hypothetical protein